MSQLKTKGGFNKIKITSQSETGHRRCEDEFIDSVEKGTPHTRT